VLASGLTVEFVVTGVPGGALTQLTQLTVLEGGGVNDLVTTPDRP